MSKDQLINLITTGHYLSIPAFKMEYIAMLSKREVNVSYICYSYGYLSSKTDDEVYQVFKAWKSMWLINIMNKKDYMNTWAYKKVWDWC